MIIPPKSTQDKNNIIARVNILLSIESQQYLLGCLIVNLVLRATCLGQKNAKQTFSYSVSTFNYVPYGILFLMCNLWKQELFTLNFILDPDLPFKWPFENVRHFIHIPKALSPHHVYTAELTIAPESIQHLQLS